MNRPHGCHFEIITKLFYSNFANDEVWKSIMISKLGSFNFKNMGKTSKFTFSEYHIPRYGYK